MFGARANQSPFADTSKPGGIGRRKPRHNPVGSMKYDLAQLHSEPVELFKVRKGSGMTEYKALAKHHAVRDEIKVTLYSEDIMFLRKACGVDASQWSKPGFTSISIEITLKTKDTRFPRILGAWTTDGEYIEREEWVERQRAGGAA